MGTPFLGEIRLFSCAFAPKGWAHCDGGLLPIDQNPGFFSLIRTTYGGDGKTTFGLPKMQGRAAIAAGAGYANGSSGGEETHTLAVAEMPVHTHAWNARISDGTSPSPGGQLYAKAKASMFGAPTDFNAMNVAVGGPAGEGKPHENRQPYLALNFCVAITGDFPKKG